jgi:hypothetical protein
MPAGALSYQPTLAFTINFSHRSELLRVADWLTLNWTSRLPTRNSAMTSG